jgi:hypothetical protein
MSDRIEPAIPAWRVVEPLWPSPPDNDEPPEPHPGGSIRYNPTAMMGPAMYIAFFPKESYTP